MGYRFLIINTDYPGYLKWLYSRHHGLENKSYEEQLRARNDSLFGAADFYSRNLNKLGHQAFDIHANNYMMQKAWARKHKLKLIPWVSRLQQKWLYDIMSAQVRHYKPDIIINHDITLNPEFFRQIKPRVRLLIGQCAAPFNFNSGLRGLYGLMVSSLPNLVDYFKNEGMRSEYLRLGFEPEVLESLSAADKNIPVSFVGSLSGFHTGRNQWLDYVFRNVDVDVWAQARSRAAWGIQMYRVLNASKITLNHHIDIAGDYANNMRLFEATGVGTMLITDWKKNLNEMFEPGKEIAAYRSPQECVEMIKYYLSNDEERQAVARRAQQRTLKEHTYGHRMRELVDIINKFIRV